MDDWDNKSNKSKNPCDLPHLPILTNYTSSQYYSDEQFGGRHACDEMNHQGNQENHTRLGDAHSVYQFPEYLASTPTNTGYNGTMKSIGCAPGDSELYVNPETRSQLPYIEYPIRRLSPDSVPENNRFSPIRRETNLQGNYPHMDFSAHNYNCILPPGTTSPSLSPMYMGYQDPSYSLDNSQLHAHQFDFQDHTHQPDENTIYRMSTDSCMFSDISPRECAQSPDMFPNTVDDIAQMEELYAISPELYVTALCPMLGDVTNNYPLAYKEFNTETLDPKQQILNRYPYGGNILKNK